MSKVRWAKWFWADWSNDTALNLCSIPARGARRYNCIDYLEHVHLCGGDLDRMENHAKAITSIDEFESAFDGWLESIGRPF